MPRIIVENIVIQHLEEVSSIEFCQYTPIRFFEILFIKKGKGSLIINKHKVPYNDHQIFTFVPNDQYNFKIEAPTTVFAIKFLNNFFSNFSNHNNAVQQKEWFKKIEAILHSANRAAQVQLRSKTEESSLFSLFTVLCNEYKGKTLESEWILKNTLHSILQIISRNVSYVASKTTNSKIQGIINYIHYHIHNNDLLSQKAIATQFNISENYIGQYFKAQMGISLKKYILTHKIKLAETSLLYTNSTLSEIAFELGFTDSSHLDKTFLSYKGITAGAYRLNPEKAT